MITLPADIPAATSAEIDRVVAAHLRGAVLHDLAGA